MTYKLLHDKTVKIYQTSGKNNFSYANAQYISCFRALF